MQREANVMRSVRALLRDLFEVRADRTCFWSGAGISADAPTQAPDGQTLTKRAISEAFDKKALLEALLPVYASLGLNRTLPRLESVLEVAAAEHGVDVLQGLLCDLSAAEPNANHRFFAEHTIIGGWHVTANFDTCIEGQRADPARVVHFHGLFSGPGGVGDLGARLSRVERGFAKDEITRLDAIVRAIDCLVIVGYSGSDFFDVDPYWRGVADRGLLSGSQVIWLDYRDDNVWDISTGALCTREQLRRFHAGGSDVFELRGPTRDALNVIAEMWGLSEIPAPPAWEDRDQPRVVLSESAKGRATTRFLASAGAMKAVRKRLDQNAYGAEEHRWAAEAAWSAGRYRAALRHWELAYDTGHIETHDARAGLDDRRAACMWLRGQHLLARRLLRRTILEAVENGVDPELRLAIAETLGRVLVHMRRLPDTRPFVTGSWIRFSVDHLNTAQAAAETAAGKPLGSDLSARVNSVRADLLRVSHASTRRGRDPIHEFDEAEALLPMLNYAHAELRARASSDSQPSPERWEYVRHRDHFLALGAEGDAARVPLLPGAARAFTIIDAIRGILKCDFTPYHRARLVAAYLLSRARTP